MFTNTFKIHGKILSSGQAFALRPPENADEFGKAGISHNILEGASGWHGKPLDREQMNKALAELGDVAVNLTVQPQRVGQYQTRHAAQPPAIAGLPSVEIRKEQAPNLSPEKAIEPEEVQIVLMSPSARTEPIVG
jgi:hypothetical protein